MAGPVLIDIEKRPLVQFGTARRDDVPNFLGIMSIIHQEPNSSAFGRLLAKRLEPADELPLAHLFEEISTLAVHGLLVEDVLFDAFAFDYYWDELKGRIHQVRSESGNEKFCENFEIAAELAAEYRAQRPPKVHPRQAGA